MMPHKGKIWAYIFIGMGEIMHQLNALTAYKIGELSLIRSSSAFRRIYSNFDSEKKQWNEKDAFQRISRGKVIYA
ncbi:hypothetical protein BMS3Bbin15_00574 [archaeon BMS3Bbin15]|nr:hypothetical protein BMS3Bbin15_00574 [archaeon BMS3Bbin15]